MFKPIEGETAVLVSGGVYKPCPLYVRGNGELFAKVGSGYVRLKQDGSCSDSKHRIDVIQIEAGELTCDAFGKMFIGRQVGEDGLKPVTKQSSPVLIEAIKP